jgi:hypothetical protein
LPGALSGGQKCDSGSLKRRTVKAWGASDALPVMLSEAKHLGLPFQCREKELIQRFFASLRMTTMVDVLIDLPLQRFNV